MARRVRGAALALCVLATVAAHATADERPAPDLDALRAAVAALVHAYYPGDTVVRADRSIRFELNTRTYMVHELSRRGDRCQDAHEEPGPQPGGGRSPAAVPAGRAASASLTQAGG